MIPEILFGIPIGRFEELVDLFMEKGYDVKSEGDFKNLKRDFFGKITKKFYNCKACGKREELTTPKQNMEKELHQDFGENFDAKDCEIVCDKCYKKMGFKNG